MIFSRFAFLAAVPLLGAAGAAQAQTLMDFVVNAPASKTTSVGVVTTFTGSWSDTGTGFEGDYTLVVTNLANFNTVSLLATTDGLNVTFQGPANNLAAHQMQWSFTATADPGAAVHQLWLSNGLGSFAKGGGSNTTSLTTASGATFTDHTAQNDVSFNGTSLIFPGAGTGNGQGFIQSSMDWDLVSAAGVSSMTGTYSTPASSVSGSDTAQEQFIIRLSAVASVPEPGPPLMLLAAGGYLYSRRARSREAAKRQV